MGLSGGVLKSAFESFVNVSEAAAFYMFIAEESVQSAQLAVYLAFQQNDISTCRELIDYNLNNLVDPMIEFCQSPTAMIAGPIAWAFEEFFKTARKNMETYKTLIAGLTD